MRIAPSSYEQCGRPCSARANEMGEGDKKMFFPDFRDAEHRATGCPVEVCTDHCKVPWGKAIFSSGVWEL